MFISIHVLRVEDDVGLKRFGLPTPNFNPRPPCGGRPSWTDYLYGQIAISIHVLRVEDDSVRALMGNAKTISIHVLRVEDDTPYKRGSPPRRISIHVLRVEDDVADAGSGNGDPDFNPRPPCGGRQP